MDAIDLRSVENEVGLAQLGYQLCIEETSILLSL